MKLTKCANKHFFDADQFDRCPHCDKAGLTPMPAFQVGPMRHVRTEEPGATPSSSISPIAKSNIPPQGQIQGEGAKTEMIMGGFVVGAYNQPAEPSSPTPNTPPEPQSPIPAAPSGAEATGKALFCGHCGTAFHGTGVFCIMCGAKVTTSLEGAAADAAEAPPSPDELTTPSSTPEAKPSASEEPPAASIPETESEAVLEAHAAEATPHTGELTPPLEAAPAALAKVPGSQASLQSQINAVSSHSQGEDVKTMAFYNFSDVEPVVGWLVSVKGEYIGQSFNLKAGQNFVGRSLTMDVPLAKDTSVSRNKHTIITFDPQSRDFFIQPGESSGLTYLNGEVVLAYQPISAYDSIKLGGSELLFLPFCGVSFSWEESA